MAWWPSRAPGSGRAPYRSTPPVPGGRVSCGWTPGVDRWSGGRWEGPRGLFADRAGPVDPAQRRSTVDLGCRPHRPHPLPRARRARGSPGRPLVPGAGRLPGHAVHRHRRRVDSLHGRGLADRQPAPTTSPLRPGTGESVGRSRMELSPRPDPQRDRNGATGSGRPTRARSRGGGGGRDTRPAFGGRRSRGRPRPPPIWPSRRPAGSAVPPPGRRPTRSTR